MASEKVQGGQITMMKIEETKMDVKREQVIQQLVDQGIFKINGKQLYQLPLFSLLKEYFIRV